ncbi:YraN family protein [Corticibacter populi]|uniref:UPF0102 protein D8I35_18555 n=1 Tax=Corticibacter populi TaxID=1550736 RepID=A0A3M6QJG7_9BURK|nr:YraN family protein [Corticibacter populi]RMX02642.1 YraN family protein [Corticibacter populi]RZS32938.1 putative endonuclease [Corticibacter populi]
MGFLARFSKTPASAAAAAPVTRQQRGQQAEQRALQWLRAAGLRLQERNYRTPGRGGGEIDLIMRAPDGTLVFVEVRQRSSAGHGGAGASIDARKQRRIILAARHYLAGLSHTPPCRFDVVLLDGSDARVTPQWLPAAFSAD